MKASTVGVIFIWYLLFIKKCKEIGLDLCILHKKTQRIYYILYSLVIVWIPK